MPPNLLAHNLYLEKPQWYGKPLKQRGLLSRQANIRQVTGASSVTISRPEEHRACCGAVSRCSVRPDRMLTVARLPRFYNKFRLQSDRSTTNAERAAVLKLARL